MTIASYKFGGDFELCQEIQDKTEFLASIKKFALQKNLSERTLMLRVYQQAHSKENAERIKRWIQEEDSTQRWLLSTPEY